ncbi:MAG: hypothetical protein IPF77_08070 [Gemmatimonadetes bacterium]|jgi:hypothetical protein|nr:hypothetical protein [Gemmatimonadota bacterium]MBP9199742.1 hypothetical protein [Gemmatimonadales bacterium]
MRRPRLRILLALGLATLTTGASRLAAQDARLVARLRPEIRVAVDHLVDSARAAGLPGEPLVRKALEGESKGADSGRIVAAVRTLARLLGDARRSIGPGASEADLVAGAAALRAGATSARLAALAALRPRESLTVPLSVLADLLTAGVEPERAWSNVRDMASRAASDAAFLALRERLADEVHAPLPPPAERPPAGLPRPAPTGSPR